MSQHQDFQRIVEQAKQQRAEYIGSAIRANAIPIAGIAALAIVLLQFVGEPPQQEIAGSYVVASVDAQR